MNKHFGSTLNFVYEHYMLILISVILVSATLYFFRDSFILEESKKDEEQSGS